MSNKKLPRIIKISENQEMDWIDFLAQLEQRLFEEISYQQKIKKELKRKKRHRTIKKYQELLEQVQDGIIYRSWIYRAMKYQFFLEYWEKWFDAFWSHPYFSKWTKPSWDNYLDLMKPNNQSIEEDLFETISSLQLSPHQKAMLKSIINYSGKYSNASPAMNVDDTQKNT